MMQIIDEVFDTRNDPQQIQVNEEARKKLISIHPAVFSEYNEGNGPCIWTLLIPTTEAIMNLFVTGKITEQELLEQTQPGGKYDVIYLCSVTALPEYRGKGLSLKLCSDAIRKICKDHPVKYLLVWPFTEQGNQLAEKLSKKFHLSLKKRRV